MSNEVKIALLAIAALALSYWGYKFIIGKNVLVKSNLYYVEYPDVDELMMGTSVTVSGVRVGSVASIDLMKNEYGRVLVTLDLDKDMNVPKDARAVLLPKGFMGGKVIKLVYDNPCNGAGCAKSGDYLQGQTWGMVESMLGEGGLEGYMEIVKDGLEEVFDTINSTLLGSESDSPLAQSVKKLDSTLENLKSASFQLDLTMRKSGGKIDGTLDNLYSLTGSIEKKSDKIGSIIDNADQLSGQLAEADLKKTMNEVNASIASLKSTLTAAEETVNGLNNVIGKINNQEGTLGKLMGDEKLYNNLNSMTYRLDTLMNDFQERPYRYMPLKSRKKVKRFDRQDAASTSN